MGIPDPTTEGNFCRRFRPADVLALMEAINKARLRVYAQQPADFFTAATVDIEGTLVGTDAECKEGVDIDHDGTSGYQPDRPPRPPSCPRRRPVPLRDGDRSGPDGPGRGTAAADAPVLEADGRCDQEDVIAHLREGVHALSAPARDTVSHWARMVMASLARTLKAWAAVLLPEEPWHSDEHGAERRSWLRKEFATFREAVIAPPCQVVRVEAG